MEPEPEKPKLDVLQTVTKAEPAVTEPEKAPKPEPAQVPKLKKAEVKVKPEPPKTEAELAPTAKEPLKKGIHISA